MCANITHILLYLILVDEVLQEPFNLLSGNQYISSCLAVDVTVFKILYALTGFPCIHVNVLYSVSEVGKFIFVGTPIKRIEDKRGVMILI